MRQAFGNEEIAIQKFTSRLRRAPR